MTKSRFSNSDLMASKAIMASIGLFKFEKKTELFINGLRDIGKINKDLERYGLKCYNEDSTIPKNFSPETALKIQYLKSWTSVKNALTLHKTSINLSRQPISYILLIQEFHPLIRFFMNLFFIMYIRLYIRKRPDQFVSFCSLDEPNFTDTIEAWPKTNLKQPFKRTVKNFIKVWMNNIRLFYKPLFFIFEVKDG
jgi:hypothetical protein